MGTLVRAVVDCTSLTPFTRSRILLPDGLQFATDDAATIEAETSVPRGRLIVASDTGHLYYADANGTYRNASAVPMGIWECDTTTFPTTEALQDLVNVSAPDKISRNPTLESIVAWPGVGQIMAIINMTATGAGDGGRLSVYMTSRDTIIDPIPLNTPLSPFTVDAFLPQATSVANAAGVVNSIVAVPASAWGYWNHSIGSTDLPTVQGLRVGMMSHTGGAVTGAVVVAFIGLGSGHGRVIPP